MGSVSAVRAETASKVVARDQTVVEIFATSRKPAKWFPGLAKRISKDKPAAAIHHLTSEAERTCYDWCKGSVDPPSRAIIKLLHTGVGWLVLEYLMRGCKEPWWLETVRARRCASAYEHERQQFSLDLG